MLSKEQLTRGDGKRVQTHERILLSQVFFCDLGMVRDDAHGACGRVRECEGASAIAGCC